MNKNAKNILGKTINFLIEEKEKLNADINDILYCDMGCELKQKDLIEINRIRGEISYIYSFIQLIERLDKEIKNND